MSAARFANDRAATMPEEINGRVLSLAIPKGSMTEEQRIVIEAVRDRATRKKNPVDLIITEF